MYKIKFYRPLFYIVGFFLIISFLVWWLAKDSFSQNLYIALTTFFVGIFVVYVYLYQKSDEKRNAANMIINEIRGAELMIKELKKTGLIDVLVAEQLLTSNSWDKYRYLFIKDLDSDQFNAINNFYAMCAYADKLRLHLSSSKQYEQKTEQINRVLMDIISEIVKEAVESSQAETSQNIEAALKKFDKKKNFLWEIAKRDIFFNFTMYSSAPKQKFMDTLKNIQFIIDTPAGNILKKIAGIN